MVLKRWGCGRDRWSINIVDHGSQTPGCGRDRWSTNIMNHGSQRWGCARDRWSINIVDHGQWCSGVLVAAGGVQIS